MNDFFCRFHQKRASEEGFTIIEVLVSFTLLALVTIGTVPLFVSGLRGSLVAKMDSGGKNLSQQRIESMRNTPFHIDVVSPSPPAACNTPSYTKADAAAASCDYRDMLDTFFRSASAFATSTVGSGYVAGTTVCASPDDVCSGNGRTKDEPSAGLFYRFVFDPVPGFARYKQFVTTQFLDTNRNPITPSASYNSQVGGVDLPPTRLVGVTVITTWAVGALTKKFVTFTQIADARPVPASVVLRSNAVALEISTTLSDGKNLRFQAGVSNSDGSLSAGGSASNKALSAAADLEPTARVEGRTRSASAPPNQVSATEDLVDNNTLTYSGTTLVRFLRTSVANVGATISQEQPIVATPTAQSIGRLRRGNGGGVEAVTFTNLLSSDSTIMPFLNPVEETVRIIENGSSTLQISEGGSYLRSVAGASHFAEAGARTSGQTVYLFPSTIAGAEQGIIKVTLNIAQLKCYADASSKTATAFGATTSNPVDIIVQYWSNTAYQTVSINSLPIPEATIVSGTTTLANFITSWTAQTTPTTTITGNRVNAEMTVLSVLSKPLRSDTNSDLDVKIGTMSCTAEDSR